MTVKAAGRGSAAGAEQAADRFRGCCRPLRRRSIPARPPPSTTSSAVSVTPVSPSAPPVASSTPVTVSLTVPVTACGDASRRPRCPPPEPPPGAGGPTVAAASRTARGRVGAALARELAGEPVVAEPAAAARRRRAEPPGRRGCPRPVAGGGETEALAAATASWRDRAERCPSGRPAGAACDARRRLRRRPGAGRRDRSRCLRHRSPRPASGQSRNACSETSTTNADHGSDDQSRSGNGAQRDRPAPGESCAPTPFPYVRLPRQSRSTVNSA